MSFFWLALTVLLIAAFLIAISRRKRYESVEEEPWRASLQEDDELDMDAVREAEEEWLREEEWNGDAADEPWRG